MIELLNAMKDNWPVAFVAIAAIVAVMVYGVVRRTTRNDDQLSMLRQQRDEYSKLYNSERAKNAKGTVPALVMDNEEDR